MTAPPAGSEDFYCAETLTGRTAVVKIRETAEVLALLDVVREVAAQVVSETGACRIQTNLGRYQDTQHLHWHVFSGDRLS